MGKCVYCGKNLPEKPFKAKVHTRSFEVCCDDCKLKTEEYVSRDKRYKTIMYIMIFLGGIGFILSAMFGDGENNMLGAYIGQIIAGTAFLLLPYPITSFETFNNVPIKNVTLISRIIGAFLTLWGIVLIFIM